MTKPALVRTDAGFLCAKFLIFRRALVLQMAGLAEIALALLWLLLSLLVVFLQLFNLC